MSESITAQQGIDMRDTLEEALRRRIEQTLNRLDAHAGKSLSVPDDVDYLADQDRIDLFFEADRLKFTEGSKAERFERYKSPWVWATRTCQPFPGRNRFVRKLEDGLELWFRVEFAFRGFAGYTVYDTKDHVLIRFADIPEDIAESLYQEFHVTSDQVASNCWWVINRYLPYGDEASSPNFRMMDDMSLHLLDDDAFETFCKESESLVDDLIDLTR